MHSQQHKQQSVTADDAAMAEWVALSALVVRLLLSQWSLLFLLNDIGCNSEEDGRPLSPTTTDNISSSSSNPKVPSQIAVALDIVQRRSSSALAWYVEALSVTSSLTAENEKHVQQRTSHAWLSNEFTGETLVRPRLSTAAHHDVPSCVNVASIRYQPTAAKLLKIMLMVMMMRRNRSNRNERKRRRSVCRQLASNHQVNALQLLG